MKWRTIMKRKKIIRAGRFVHATVYSAPNNLRDGARVRAAKKKASSAARQRINDKVACRKCEYLLETNFDEHDYVVTATYEKLPASRSAADRRVRSFFERLRKTGREVKYIYVTEGKHGSEDMKMDKRFHHHIVINGTGNVKTDVEAFKKAWTWGNIHVERVEPLNMAALAQYLTKEPREEGRKVGARAWRQSRNLKRWIEENGVCDDNETITPPPGSIVLSNEEERVIDIFGSYKYIKYYNQPHLFSSKYVRKSKKE